MRVQITEMDNWKENRDNWIARSPLADKEFVIEQSVRMYCQYSVAFFDVPWCGDEKCNHSPCSSFGARNFKEAILTARQYIGDIKKALTDVEQELSRLELHHGSRSKGT